MSSMFLKLSHVQYLGFDNFRSVIFSYISQSHQLLKSVRFFLSAEVEIPLRLKKVYVRLSLNNVYVIGTLPWSVKTKIPWVPETFNAPLVRAACDRPRNIYAARD